MDNKKTAPKSSAFLLNMQIIVDALEDLEIKCEKNILDDKGRLRQVKFYVGQDELEEDSIYLVEGKNLPSVPVKEKRTLISFISIGNLPPDYFYHNYSLVIIKEEMDLFQLYEIVQGVFSFNRQWNDELQAVLNNNGGVQELCEVAYPYFKNPLFVHNVQFYIIACPAHETNMDPWVKDERTGLDMLSAELINDFKLNPIYQKTLETKGPQIYPKEQVGYRVLYINIWNDYGRYEGRVCIDELHSEFREGQYLALEHLAKLIQVALRRRNAEDTSFSRPFETFLCDVISGKMQSEKTIKEKLELNGWKNNDSYLCIKIGVESKEYEVMSLVSTSNYLEASFKDSYTVFYEGSIVLLLNLTQNGKDTTKCINSLAYIVREGLLKAGISNVFVNFSQASHAYYQASIALYYGNKKQPMQWIHKYCDYALDYIFNMACKEMPVEFVCSDKLKILLTYDADNKTEFYKTLKIYLKNEQNAEKTARELFVHRSTLFYRLKKIKVLTGLNWSNEKERLYLLISLYFHDCTHC